MRALRRRRPRSRAAARAARCRAAGRRPCRRPRTTRSSSCTAATSADDDRRDRRAADRAETADDDDDEREDQQARPLLGLDDVEVDAAEDAGDRRGDAADREDERERLAHVDAERLHHRAVLDAGADDQPVARPAQEELQQAEHDGRGRDLDPAVVRDVRAADVGRLVQPRRDDERLRVGSPDAGDERDERELQADGDEHLLDVARVERPDQHELDERREDAADDEPEQRARAASARATSGCRRRRAPTSTTSRSCRR